jgi:putative inorganic carbon (hco3(-)) transporter
VATQAIRFARRASGAKGEDLESLPLGGLVRSWLAEPWSFKFTCLYVFFEYVRPQQIYPALTVLPWALGSLAAACLCFFLEGNRLRSRTLMNGLVIAFTIVVVLSSVLAVYPDWSFRSLNVFVNWFIVFFLVANSVTSPRRLLLFVLLFLLWSTKMSQHGLRSWASRGFTFDAWGLAGAPGWFQNSGEFALQMCIFVPLALQLMVGVAPRVAKWKLAVLAFLPISGVASIAGSSSRGGLLGLAAVAVWLLMASQRKLRMAIVLVVAAPIVWTFVPEAQKQRFQSAGEDRTSLTRLAYWKAGLEMANTYPVFGVGYENWTPYYRHRYPPDGSSVVRYDEKGEVVTEVSHNSFVEVMSQLGYTGLLLFLALIGSIWVVNARTRRLLLVAGERGRLLRSLSVGIDAGLLGFCVAGFFMAVAFFPFLWFHLAMTAALNVAARELVAPRRAGNAALPGGVARAGRRVLTPLRAQPPAVAGSSATQLPA